MKVKATKKGYYGNKVRKVGEIFDYKEKDKNLPSWLTLADGIETSKTHKNQKELKLQENQQLKITDTKSDTEKQQYLDFLINESIEKNIVIENTDTKSIDEQIIELEAKLGEV